MSFRGRGRGGSHFSNSNSTNSGGGKPPPPQRQQQLFASARRSTAATTTPAGPPDQAAQDAAIFGRLWRTYCAPLALTHHKGLTYADPVVGELWRLFAPLLQRAAVVPLDPSDHHNNGDDDNDEDGNDLGSGAQSRRSGHGSNGGEEEETEETPRRFESQLSKNAARVIGSGGGSGRPMRSAFADSDDEDEADRATAGGDGEPMPVSHVFCIHLRPGNEVSVGDNNNGNGNGCDDDGGPFPTCTAEMQAALTEQPRIMVPLLEFLASVMALQTYQQQRANGNSNRRRSSAGVNSSNGGGASNNNAVAASQLQGVHPFSGGGETPRPPRATSAFDPTTARLYICVVGDTARPASFALLGAAQLGRMITVRGTIVRMSPPRITCLRMAYRCGLCGVEKRQAAEDGLLVYPTTCEGRCRGYKWSPLPEESECEEVQILKVQEVTDFFVDVTGNPSGGGGGGMTKVIEVELRAPWLDRATVGDMVNVTGILSTRRGDRKAGGTQQICIRARSLLAARQGGGGGDRSGGGGGGESASARAAAVTALFAPQQQQQQQPLWSPEEAARFYEMSRHPQWFARLSHSVAPSLYGLRKEKEAVLLAMIGGSSAASKIGARSNIHLLLLGDPGMGKSQLLRAACAVAPRSAFVCAHTSSSCGLTMTMSRDPVSGETAFEAGAVVHGDGGITCIDELDKAAAEHKALLEVMEQESVSIAKAGMVFSMPVHTSVLAAGNPLGGRFDFSKPITQNLNLSPALLSRFDIVICLRDAPQKAPQQHQQREAGVDNDDDALCASNLTSHVLELHRHGTTTSGSTQHGRIGGSGGRPNATAGGDSPAALPHALVQDYIIFSRAQSQPSLSHEACDILRHHYLSERAKRAASGNGSSSFSSSSSSSNMAAGLHPVTPRYLQALIRVAEARAKVELRLEVTPEDAAYAVHLLQSCLGSFSSGPTNSSLLGPALPANAHGSTRRKRNQQEQIVDLLKAEIAENNSGVNMLSHATIIEACEAVGCRNPNAMLHQLNEYGILLSSAGKYTLRGV